MIIVALTIALVLALMVGSFAVGHSRAERARSRAQRIADFAAAIARTDTVETKAVETKAVETKAAETDAAGTHVVSLDAYRVRRLTSALADGQRSQRATHESVRSIPHRHIQMSPR